MKRHLRAFLNAAISASLASFLVLGGVVLLRPGVFRYNAFDVIGLCVGVALVAVQLLVAHKLQSGTDRILGDLNDRIDAGYRNFSGIMRGVIEILDAADSEAGGVIRLSLPLYSFGSIHPDTRGSLQRDFSSRLCSLISSGREVHLLYPELSALSSLADRPGILKRLDMVRALSPQGMQASVRANLKEQLEECVVILEAVEASMRRFGNPRPRTKLYWRSSVHLYMVLSEAGQREAVVFIVGSELEVTRAREELRKEGGKLLVSHIDQFSEGLRFGGGRGALIFPSLFRRWTDEVGDLFDKCEPRLLKTLCKDALSIAPSQQPGAVLREVGESLGSIERFRYVDVAGDRVVPCYSWGEASERRIFVIPSAAGLYASWRGGQRLGSSRFKRYAVLCQRLAAVGRAEVVLVSQPGQAGVGKWSLERGATDLERLIEAIRADDSRNTPYAVFGICTGGLVCLSLLANSEILPPESVMLWDLAKEISFSRRSRNLVAEQYGLVFESDAAFQNVPQAEELARKVAARQVHTRFWVGGVDSAEVVGRESGRSWRLIEPVSKALGEETATYVSANIGHIPGEANPSSRPEDFESFLEAIGDFLAREVFNEG